MTASDFPTKPDAPQPIAAAYLARREVTRIACGEVNNRDAKRYWVDVLGPNWHGPYPKSWCGGFALWCLRQAHLTDLLWVPPFGFLSDGKRWRFDRTKHPEPGDIGYIDKPFQHYFVVVETTPTEVASIDGNQGTGIVLARRRKLTAAAYFSIANLLPKTPAPPAVNA